MNPHVIIFFIVNLATDRAKRISQFFKKLSKKTSEEARTPWKICEKEFGYYVDEDIIDFDKNPLYWWRENKSRFPNIWNVAKNYLATPASQASSERIFSIQGNTIYEKRKQLDPTVVEQMAFLHDNDSIGELHITIYLKL